MEEKDESAKNDEKNVKKDSEEVKKRKRNSDEGKETEKSKKMKESRTVLAPTSTGRKRFLPKKFQSK